jgi:hypothetical protein
MLATSITTAPPAVELRELDALERRLAALTIGPFPTPKLRFCGANYFCLGFGRRCRAA